MSLIAQMRIGTAAWSIPRDSAASFPTDGSHLQRYAQTLNCVEINSSFYRPHRVTTYRRWASETPASFRFAVKLPKAITHEARLKDVEEPLMRFIDEVSGLGDRLAVVLVQLPPSLAFEPSMIDEFFLPLRALNAASIVCEPRHASWFTPETDRLLVDAQIARAAADPAHWPTAAQPGGWLGPDGDGRGAVLYHRWHGSPKMYWSCYSSEWLSKRVAELSRWHADAERWCIFDNTAAGAATANALELQTVFRKKI